MATKAFDLESENLFKIVLVGDAGVGKTNLLSRYIKGNLPKVPSPTIGVEFATRTVPLPSGGTVKAQIWDTAGQERYRAITSAHYKRAVGALLVYDVVRQDSFENCKRWLEDLKGNAEPDIVVMLVGNKLDLVERNEAARQVTTELGQKFADQHGLLFQETSAVTTANVKEAFEVLLLQIYNQRSKSNGGSAPRRMDPAQRLAANPTQPKEQGCCG